MSVTHLEGRLVRLERLEVGHVPALVAAASESRSTYGWSWIPDGEQTMRAYVEEALGDPDHLAFATRALADDRIVGSTRYHQITPWTWPPGHPLQRTDRPDVVEIGHTWLAASAQRTGMNVDAKYVMLRQAFDVWDVHAVHIRTDRRNERSRRAIERLGATLDGIRRAERPGADGTVRDSALYSITREEWPAAKERLQARMVAYKRSTM